MAMKNVDLTDAYLSLSQTKGLIAYADALRECEFNYQEGLRRAKQFVFAQGGEVTLNEQETHLTLNQETITCFKPYKDIDRFYYEG